MQDENSGRRLTGWGSKVYRLLLRVISLSLSRLIILKSNGEATRWLTRYAALPTTYNDCVYPLESVLTWVLEICTGMGMVGIQRKLILHRLTSFLLRAYNADQISCPSAIPDKGARYKIICSSWPRYIDLWPKPDAPVSGTLLSGIWAAAIL